MKVTMRKKGLGVVGAAVAATCLLLAGWSMSPLVQSAEAVTLQPLTIGQMTEYSESVLVARVVSSTPRFVAVPRGSSSLGTVETLVELQVIEALKGVDSSSTQLVLPGGTAGGVTMWVDYVPAFNVGEMCVVFLDGMGRVVGGPQGKLDVVDGDVVRLGVPLAQLRGWVKAGAAGAGSLIGSAAQLSAGGSLGAAADFPLINGISPSSASAGTNSQVTIKGSGFGASQGTGYVSFWYGNLGHATITAPVVSWSDSAIVCVVPTAVIDNYNASAGSGPVTVTTAAGQTSNNFDFHVTFSYSGSRWMTAGFSYRVNANTSDTDSEEAMVKAAAVTWNGASNFRFVDGGSCTTTSAKNSDGHNDIFWSASELPAGVAAAAFMWSEGGNQAHLVEADIVFNDGSAMPPWGDGSNGTIDVQAVALHEMGHTLGLLDLYGPNDRGKAMYGIEENFTISPRTLSDDDRAGAGYIYGGGSGGAGAGEDEIGTWDDTNSDAKLFSDLSPDNPYFPAITDLAGKGIVTGFSDGTFRPDQTVTRQQFAKMIVKTLGLPVTGKEVSPFTDVVPQSGSDPLYPSKYVAVCAANGITTGKTATTFAPKETITRQQLITMVARAAQLTAPPASYTPEFMAAQFATEDHYLNAAKAAYVGLLDGLVGMSPTYDFSVASTRAECAQLLSTMLHEQPEQGPRVMFADDFSGDEAGWPEFQWPDWRWLIDPSVDEYICSIDTASTLTLSTLPDMWGASTLEVDAHCTTTVDEVSYGVVFRVSSDTTSFYGFTVSSKGAWQLWRRTKGVWGEAEVLAEKSSTVISKGRAWNHVRVTTDGPTIDMWVNGTQVYTFSGADGTSGLLGVVAATSTQVHGQVAVIFDNLKIWSVR